MPAGAHTGRAPSPRPRTGAGRAPSCCTHSILRARAHPSAVWIGRAEPPRRASAPERLRRLPIPAGCQNKSFPPCHRRAEWRPPPHFLGPPRRGRRAGGGWPVRSHRSGRTRPGSGGSWPGARRLLSAPSGRSHHVSGASRCFSACFSLPLASSPRPPPPARAGPLTSWTTARGRLCPSDVSSPQSCGDRCSRRRALRQSPAGLSPGA